MKPHGARQILAGAGSATVTPIPSDAHQRAQRMGLLADSEWSGVDVVEAGGRPLPAPHPS
jgi:hypothetical protein